MKISLLNDVSFKFELLSMSLIIDSVQTCTCQTKRLHVACYLHCKNTCDPVNKSLVKQDYGVFTRCMHKESGSWCSLVWCEDDFCSRWVLKLFVCVYVFSKWNCFSAWLWGWGCKCKAFVTQMCCCVCCCILYLLEEDCQVTYSHTQQCATNSKQSRQTKKGLGYRFVNRK